MSSARHRRTPDTEQLGGDSSMSAGAGGGGVAVRVPSSSTQSYTVDDALDRCGTWDAFPWMMLCYCGMSWMCDAMEVMVLSYLGPSAKCEWGLTTYEEAGLNSVVFAGMCVGAPVWGMVSDTWGRKTSFFLATLISGVFGFASALAPNFHALMAFRTLVGFGIPAATVAFSMILEFTPTRQRGLFAVAIEGFWTLGTVIQALLAYTLLNKYGWRVLVAVSTTPYALLLLLLPFVPESPRYLLVKGRVDAAERVLGRVMRVCRRQLPEGQLQPLLVPSGAELQRPDTPLDGELDGSNSSGKAGRMGRAVWRGVLTVWGALKQLFSRQLWAVTVVLIFMWVVSALVYYGLVILVPNLEFVEGEHKECRNGHLTIPRGDLIGNLVTSAAEVPGLIFSLCLIHFVSRKLAFAVPMAAIPIPLIPLMAGVAKYGGVVACMFLARFCIYSAFNALWALCPEYYPTTVRNFGLGLSNSASRIGGLISPFVVSLRQPGKLAWGHAPEAIFAALAALAAATVFLLPQDKKGRSLDDTLEDVKDVAPLQRGLSSLTGRMHSGDAAGGKLPTTTSSGSTGWSSKAHQHQQQYQLPLSKGVDDGTLPVRAAAAEL